MGNVRTTDGILWENVAKEIAPTESGDAAPVEEHEDVAAILEELLEEGLIEFVEEVEVEDSDIESESELDEADEGDAEGDEIAPPKPGALKGDWIAYRLAQGYSSEELDGLTVAKLKELQ